MNAGESTEDCEIVDLDVPCQSGIVREDRVVSYLAIVGDVTIRHYPIFVSKAGYAATVAGTTIDRAVFPNRVAVSYFQPRFADTVKLLVLRIAANTTKCADRVIRADRCRSNHYRMRLDASTGADLYASTDERPGTDFDIRR